MYVAASDINNQNTDAPKLFSLNIPPKNNLRINVDKASDFNNDYFRMIVFMK
jgi:hypothetical protein